MIEFGSKDFERSLAELKPLIGNYGWIWNILRMRTMGKSGSWEQRFPHRTFNALRRFLDPRKPYFIGRTVDNVLFLGDYRDIYALYSGIYRNHDQVLIDFLKKHSQPERGPFLDIGSNMGVVAASIGKFFNDHLQIIAFEPLPQTAKRAAATFALNGLKNVRLFQVAISDDNIDADFFFMEQCTAIASATYVDYNMQIPYSKTKVSCRTLDGLLMESGVNAVSLIKIDVEGHELKVLSGAKQTIKRNTPRLIYEYNPIAASAAGWGPADVNQLLTKSNIYNFHVMHEDGAMSEFPIGNTQGTVNVYCDNSVPKGILVKG